MNTSFHMTGIKHAYSSLALTHVARPCMPESVLTTSRFQWVQPKHSQQPCRIYDAR